MAPPAKLRGIPVAFVVGLALLLSAAAPASAAPDAATAHDASATRTAIQAYAASKAGAARACAAYRRARRGLARFASSARASRKLGRLARGCRTARESKRRARRKLKRRLDRRAPRVPGAPRVATPAPAPVRSGAPDPVDTVPSDPTPTPSPAPSPAGSGAMRWGIVANTVGRGSGAAAEQDRIKTTGVGWLREEFDSVPTTRTDSVVLSAAQRGLRILPLIQTDDELPSDIDAYAEIVAAHARRYGPGGTLWTEHPELDAALAATHFEIYNEPYGDWYGEVNPARYAQVLRAAVTKGRAANPRAKFLMAIDRVPGGERKTWIDDLYRAEPNLNAYFDAVAIHPYASERAPDEAGDMWGYQRIGEARANLVRHGAGDKPFWITELGWSTCSDPEWCVSEQQQADYMERAAAMAKTRYPYVEAMFFYHFRLDERNPSDSEHFYGIVHDDMSPKPAYQALRRITGAAG